MAKGIISNREQRKQFDQAVKDVIRQRKAVNQVQNAQRNNRRSASDRGTQQQSHAQSHPQQGLLHQQQQQRTRTNRRPSTRKLTPNNLTSSMTTATNNSIVLSPVINPEILQRFRDEHPHRPNTGSNASPRLNTGSNASPGGETHAYNRRRSCHGYDPTAESQPVPRFPHGNRRSSDDPASRRVDDLRPSFNRSSSFGSSLNLVQPENDDETKTTPSPLITTNTAQGQRQQSRMRRVNSEVRLPTFSATDDQGERPGTNPRFVPQSAENGTGNSSLPRIKSLCDTTLLVPTYRPKDTGSITSSSSNNKGVTDDGWGKSVDYNKLKNYEFDDVQKLGKKSSQRRLISKDSTLSGSETVDSDIVNGLGKIKEATGGRGRQQNLKQTTTPNMKDNLKQSTSPNMKDISNGIGDIKVQDLVPTRRRTQLRDNTEGIELLIERGDKKETKIREKIIQDIFEGGSCEKAKEKEKGEASTVGPPSKEIIGQWKERSLLLSPAQVDFDLGLSDTDSDVEIPCCMEKSSEKGKPKGVGECISSTSEASPPPSRELLQQQSHSGATGRTQGTSSSSLFSSASSVTGANPAPSGAINGNFEAIKEEAREHGESIGNIERGELALGNNFALHSANGPGFPTYKNRRTSRIKKIRKTIRKSLMGANDGEHSGVVSHGGESAISAEQQRRVSQHLQRMPSNRSITSAYTSLSGITGKSDATSSVKSTSRWSRFRLPGKSKSMFNLDTSNHSRRGSSSSRQILATKGQSTSYVSNLSSRSNVSALSSDKSFTGKCIDFYDHTDHARAISSLVSTKSASGRSLVTSLATVKEPAHEGLGGRGEQKHDEDYNSNRVRLSAYHTFRDNSYRSDDSADSFYRHPSHEHTLVHMRPTQIFPDSPGWQCDECLQETFDLTTWAYISTEKNYVLCGCCFSKSGFSVVS